MVKLSMKMKVDFNEPELELQTLENAKSALLELMLSVEGHAKRLSPVDTGRLRAGIHTFPTLPAEKIAVGDDVTYGCIFGAQAAINCGKNKHKTIGQIKTGDSVLTQDGLLHKVIGTKRYLAIETPDLIELVYEYRKGKNHKLTLTSDHKVLCESNGCIKWVKAKDLKKNFIVFSPNKINYNIKKGERISFNCLNCGKKGSVLKSEQEKYGRGKFCSITCQIKYRYGKNNPNYGNKYSEKTKKMLSKLRKKRLKENPELHPNRILSKKGFVTNIERQVEKWIKAIDVSYKKQKHINRKFVDFFIPSLKLIIECDGAYWHQDQKKDIKRDLKIRQKFPDFFIIHLHFTDYRFSKNIEFNPMENVFYVQCNPSLGSFVNPKIFRKIKILKVTPYKYVNKSKNLGQKGKYLYDLTVEGMHSFVASGLLISNSYQEFGTSKMEGKPFLRPAKDIAMIVDLPDILKKYGLK